MELCVPSISIYTRLDENWMLIKPLQLKKEPRMSLQELTKYISHNILKLESAIETKLLVRLLATDCVMQTTHWRLPNYCNVSSWRNNLIKLIHYDETKKRAHDSQIVRAKENFKLSHRGPS